MKDKTIWEEACKLAQHPKVSARIKSIQADMETDRRMIALRREEYVLRSAYRKKQRGRILVVVK